MMSFQIDPLISDLLVYASQRSDSSGTTGSVRNGFYRLLLFIASMFNKYNIILKILQEKKLVRNNFI